MRKLNFAWSLFVVMVVLSVFVTPISAQRKGRRTQPSKPAITPTPIPVARIEANNANEPRIWAQIYGARVFKVYQDTREPEVIYATTPVGLYKTTDKGFRWNFVFAPPFPDPYVLANVDHIDYYPPATSLIFAQSKSSPNVMFLGANWRGDRYPTIWKSEDGGQNWNETSAGVIASGANPGRQISDIQLSPTNPSIVYFAFYYGPIYKSLNGGKSWGTIEGRMRLGINPANPDNLTRQGAESNDGGLTWSKRWETPNFDQITFHPINPKILFGRTGGDWRAGGDCGNCMDRYWLSEDSGQTWRDLSLTGSVWCFGFSSKSDNLLYAGTSDGVYASSTRGRSWQKIFNSGAWSLAIIDADTMYAATDNGIWKTSNGGTTWHRANFTLPIPINSSLYNHLTFNRLCWADDATGTIYVGGRGGYWTTSDEGFNWQWNSIGNNDARILSIKVCSDRTIFIVTFEPDLFSRDIAIIRIDPQGKRDKLKSIHLPNGWSGESLVGISDADSRTIYIGGSVSEDSGFSWRQTNVNSDMHEPQVIISPASPRVAYLLFSEDAGSVLATTDGGVSWNKLSMSYVPVAFVPDPKDALTVYAIIPNKLLRSRNAGATWEAVADLSRLGDLGSSFAINPVDPSVFYLLLSNGLLESKNAGKTWRLYHTGAQGLHGGDQIERLVVSGTRVLVQGRNGIYRLSDDKLSWAVERWNQYEREILPQEASKDIANASEGVTTSSARADSARTGVNTAGNPSVTNPIDELLPISKKLSEATISGDRLTIESYLTDDFVYRDVGNRKSMDRAKYLSKIRRDKSMRSYSCHDYKLSVEGEQTLLTGTCEYDITSLIFAEALHVRQRFTDRFVKRNGNWKLVGIDAIVLPNNR